MTYPINVLGGVEIRGRHIDGDKTEVIHHDTDEVEHVDGDAPNPIDNDGDDFVCGDTYRNDVDDTAEA